MLCMLDNDIQQMFAYLQSTEMKKDELYRQIVLDGYPTKYYISNYGIVVTLCRGKARQKTLQVDTKGYFYVDLYHEGIRYRFRIHQLVGQYFLREHPERGEIIHHCDTNRQNNAYNNLVYLTKSQHELWHKLHRQEESKQHA